MQNLNKNGEIKNMNILNIPDSFVTMLSNGAAFVLTLWVIILMINNDRGGHA